MPGKEPDEFIQATLGTSDGQAFSEDGVDLTLIRWMLSLIPTERLEVLQEYIWSIMRLRGEASDEPEACNPTSDKIPPDGN